MSYAQSVLVRSLVPLSATMQTLSCSNGDWDDEEPHQIAHRMNLHGSPAAQSEPMQFGGLFL
jgi:hypothetical protein